ncbi:MAG TPA: type II secretion system F family protein [Candidatus Saccharibacteria bacterium]|jgi:type IV pilus assembly protein PilC|nr:type II secretion system F family protein [Candidatus Saccharibacteria bacterium]HMT55345.1 type II secretion system F family protein [Candidatus Saccharibacteria bacterium]
MVMFSYVARDPATGKKVEGSMQADSEKTVSQILKQQGYALLEANVEESSGFFNFLKGRVKSKDKVIFSRQLSTLINAGLPLVQSLRSVLNQTDNKKMQSVLTDVIGNVEGGKSFAECLKEHPRVFDQVFVSLVLAGEASGTLDVALDRIANQQEKDAEIASKVRGAMVYPIIVLLVMVAVVTFMLVSVLPQVQELYRGLPGAKLPFVTRMLLSVSHFVTSYWWAIIGAILVLIFFTTKWARTLGGKQVIDTAKLKMWPIAPLFTKMYMARFSRTGGTLVASGVPLIQVLDITGKAINNVHVEASILHAAEKVKGGKALSDALQGDPNFLDLVPNMLKIGEDSGALEKMLEKTADYYEKEVDNQIKAISTIIEPLLMIVLGVVAIVIISAILLPIYGLVGQNLGGR